MKAGGRRGYFSTRWLAGPAFSPFTTRRERAFSPIERQAEFPASAAGSGLAREVLAPGPMTVPLRPLPHLTVLFLLTGACRAPSEEAFAEAVVTSALQTNESGGVAKEAIEAVESTCIDDPEAVAAAVAARPSVVFIPSSCVTKTAEGNAVHAELDACRGRFGRSTVDGGLDAVFTSAGECLVHADVTDSGDLRANGQRLIYDASATIRIGDGVHRVNWAAEWSGSTPAGRSIHQESQFDLIADGTTHCVDVAGDARGSVDEHDYELTVEELAVCPDECPSAGVVRAHVEGDRRERSITVRFDGSTEAHVTGWSGREFDVKMICAPVGGS